MLPPPAAAAGVLSDEQEAALWEEARARVKARYADKADNHRCPLWAPCFIAHDFFEEHGEDIANAITTPSRLRCAGVAVASLVLLTMLFRPDILHTFL